MTDKTQQPETPEMQLKQTLEKVYAAPPELPPGFGKAVMQRVAREKASNPARSSIAKIMMVYWALAGLITCALLSDGLRGLVSGQTPGLGGMALSALLTIGGLLFLARAANIRLSQLLFRTFDKEVDPDTV